MSEKERDLSHLNLETLLAEISDLSLKYYYGEFLGDSFLSLDGDDVDMVFEIQDRFGAEGIIAFNSSFGPTLERKVEERLKRLQQGFEAMQQHVHGAPYYTDEAEYIRLLLSGVPNLITNADYNSFTRRIGVFGDFLSRYQAGEAAEVYLGAKPIEVTGIYGNKGVFPEKGARTIVLQKLQPREVGTT